MLLELTELICCFVAGSGASVIGALLISKNNKPKTDPIKQGTFKWACYYGATKNDWYFICPKCDATKKNQTAICECHEYYNSHFHFQCGSCKFDGVMRTKDDP